MHFDLGVLEALAEAAKDKSNVRGYTHDFYNYPARFSPLFVREVIKTFSKKGDLILDPFVGGGTTLVEAKMLGRRSIGFDISSLAHFISNVKITPLSKIECKYVEEWVFDVVVNLKCKIDYDRPAAWIEKGYQKNLEKSFWGVRVLMEKFLFEVEKSNTSIKVKNFLRASLLKSGQWALDSKKEVPNVQQFRLNLADTILSMLNSLPSIKRGKTIRSKCLNKAAEQINRKDLKGLGLPKLILTSPPYPGVHVMYHRWQIRGRRETPAPFWIANRQDGHGLAYYTMGDRHQPGLKSYFENIYKSFSQVRTVCRKNTVVVQVVAFAEPSWQLPKYLETMENAGFEEIKLYQKRISRAVPNRKWYAQQKGETNSSKELVLFHKIK